MEMNNKKKEMVSNLKNNMLSELQDGFVENYEFWKSKMEMVNSIVTHVDSQSEVFSYNEFCIKAADVIKNTLDNEIDYEKLFLTESEFRKIEQEYPGDQTKVENAVTFELNQKYESNLRAVVEKKLLLETVKQKLGDKFAAIEKDLDESANIAIGMLKNNTGE